MFFISPALKRSHGAFAAGRGACRFVAWKGITGIPGVTGRNMIFSGSTAPKLTKLKCYSSNP